MHSHPPFPPALGGRWHGGRLLGQGAMGTVWQVQRIRDGKPVALKVLTRGALEDPETQARFELEGRLAGRELHPSLIRVLETGEIEGLPYLEMELVEGPTLRRIIDDGRPMAPDRAIGLMEQLAEGLAVLHSEGIVHRDLKPANVIVQAGDTARLLDLGLAHMTGGDLTRTGTILGTPRYLAPELILGRPCSPAADVFALGLILLECLLDRDPIDAGQRVAELLALRARGEERLPYPKRCSRSLRDCLDHLLAHEAESRCRNGSEAAQVLARMATAPLGASRIENASLPTRSLASPSLASQARTRSLSGVELPPTTAARKGLGRPAVAVPIATLALLLSVAHCFHHASPQAPTLPSAGSPPPLATGELERMRSAWAKRLEAFLKAPTLRASDPGLRHPPAELGRIWPREALCDGLARYLPDPDVDWPIEELGERCHRLVGSVDLMLRLPPVGIGEGDREDAILERFVAHGRRYLPDLSKAEGRSFEELRKDVVGRFATGKQESLSSLLQRLRPEKIDRALRRPRFRQMVDELERLWQRHGSPSGQIEQPLPHPAWELLRGVSFRYTNRPGDTERSLLHLDEALRRIDVEGPPRTRARELLRITLIYEAIRSRRYRRGESARTWELVERLRVAASSADGGIDLRCRDLYRDAYIRATLHDLSFADSRTQERRLRDAERFLAENLAPLRKNGLFAFYRSSLQEMGFHEKAARLDGLVSTTPEP